YQWTESALTVYRQNSPNVNSRTTTLEYQQNAWEPERLEQYNDWTLREDNYVGRLNSNVDANAHPQRLVSDTTGFLKRIEYTVGGVTHVIEANGNEIAAMNEYQRQLDNLDHSYYTYSNYGVGADGSRALESVTLRRLNDSEPGSAQVANAQALDGGMYLTAANWSSYISGLSANVQFLKSQPFNEANVRTLIQTAFGQTRRDDVKAPLVDGLRVFK